VTLNKIVRRYANKTNDQIAIFASSLTNKPIPCATIRALASQLGLAVVDRLTRGRSGDLFAVLDAIPSNHPLKPLARFFELHTWENGGETISSNGEESQIPGVDSFDVVVGFGSLATMIAGQALQATPTDTRFEQLRLGMIAAGGGLVFPSPNNSPFGAMAITAQMVQDARLAIISEDQQSQERIEQEELERLNQARKVQMYSALLDAANWLSIQEQCPTQAELLGYLTPNLPGE
jgi:hypothetical protein